MTVHEKITHSGGGWLAMAYTSAKELPAKQSEALRDAMRKQARADKQYGVLLPVNKFGVTDQVTADREAAVLRYITQNPGCPRRKMASDLKIGRWAIDRAVNNLREAGKIHTEKVGAVLKLFPGSKGESDGGYESCPECGIAWEAISPGRSQPRCGCADVCEACGAARDHFAVGEIADRVGGFLCPHCDAD